MDPIRVTEAVQAISGELVAPGGASLVRSISTDTRRVAPGAFFVALRGPRHDGHDHLAEAVEAGAAGLIVSRLPAGAAAERWAAEGVAIVRVGDTLAALADLARWYRSRFPIPVVAVTGSNGKTTTKEMIAAIASTRLAVHASEGTLNNQVGVPLTVLGIERRHALAVVEMGMNARGEIAHLARIAEPDVGVITNVGPAHLEFLGSLEEVAAAKAELLAVMSGGGNGARAAVLNRDDPRVAAMAGMFRLRVRTFGMGAEADVRAVDVRFTRRGARFTIRFARSGRGVRAAAPFMGIHNVMNALAAAAACEEIGMAVEDIAAGLGAVRLPPLRMERAERDGVTVVNDAYNANPASMRAAIDTVAGMAVRGARILVMGDMLELGEAAPAAHREAGRHAAARGFRALIAVGEHAAEAAAGAREGGMEPGRIVVCRDVDAAAAALRETARAGDCALLKASRRVGLERVIMEREAAGC
ncbi:MAG: UDP-N-acetylmuramoyl-tripeptide--D-alanyl-D-alanine ligase [bacterium]|nr:UDP-N-acetylmuramoyl-tripeptide--D-alanyl-D-alanine ligase [bacterium]